MRLCCCCFYLNKSRLNASYRRTNISILFTTERTSEWSAGRAKVQRVVREQHELDGGHAEPQRTVHPEVEMKNDEKLLKTRFYYYEKRY